MVKMLCQWCAASPWFSFWHSSFLIAFFCKWTVTCKQSHRCHWTEITRTGESKDLSRPLYEQIKCGRCEMLKLVGCTELICRMRINVIKYIWKPHCNFFTVTVLYYCVCLYGKLIRKCWKLFLGLVLLLNPASGVGGLCSHLLYSFLTILFFCNKNVFERFVQKVVLFPKFISRWRWESTQR